MRYTDKDRYSRDQRLEIVLDNGEDPSKWSDLFDTAITIVSGTEHITGSRSISFAKQSGSTKDVYIIRSLDKKDGYALDAFSTEGLLLSSVYLPSITDVSSYNVALLMSSGTDNGVFYSVADTDLSTGWNHLKIDCNDYTTQSGCGVDWNHVKYVAVGVSFDSASDTLAGILVDSVRVQVPTASFSFDPNIDNISVVTSLATDAANTARSTATEVVAVQTVDQTGKVSPAGNTNTNAPFSKLTDGTNDLVYTTASGVSTTETIAVPVRPIGLDGSVLEGGSGGVGGGAGVYSAKQLDCTIDYTAATQLTIAGLPTGLTVGSFIQVDVNPNGAVQESYTQKKYVFSWNDSTGVLTVTGATFAANDVDYDVLFWYTPKTYNPSTDSNSVFVVNPVDSKYTSSTLLTGTTATGDVYAYIDLQGYKYHTIQYDFTAGTVSGAVDITCQDDGTAAASCSYVPLTYSRFGVHYLTSTDILEFDTPLVGKYLRVKVSATSGSYAVYHAGVY